MCVWSRKEGRVDVGPFSRKMQPEESKMIRQGTGGTVSVLMILLEEQILLFLSLLSPPPPLLLRLLRPRLLSQFGPRDARRGGAKWDTRVQPRHPNQGNTKE